MKTRSMSVSLEQSRQQLLHSAAELADHMGGERLEGFLRRYYRHVATEDLLTRAAEDLLGAALTHRQLAQNRPVGTAKVEVFNPEFEEQGWASGHTVVQIVTDDMSFLVDSVTAELTRMGRTVHIVVHPLMLVRRDATGELEEVLDRGAADSGGVDGSGSAAEFGVLRESWMHLEIDRASDPADREQVAANLRRVLSDVREVVEDWPKMRAKCTEIAQILDQSPPVGIPAGEIEQTRRLLDWLADNHFTFLGYREYELSHDAGADVLTAVQGTGLGLLRYDAPGEGVRLSEQASGVARERKLLIVTKANSRATVHRSTYLDYVSIKTFDQAGEVTGERRFLGLFTSTAYTESVTADPRAGRQDRRDLRAHRLRGRLALRQGPPRGPRDLPARRAVPGRPGGAPRQRHRGAAPAGAPQDQAVPAQGRVRPVHVMPGLHPARPLQHRGAAQDGVDPAGRLRGRERRLHDPRLRVRAGPAALRGARPPGPEHPRRRPAVLEKQLIDATRTWDEDLNEAARTEHGEEAAARLAGLYGKAFPEAYKEDFTPRVGVADIRHMEALDTEEATELNMYQEPAAPQNERRFKLYRRGPLSLTQVLPMFTHLGVEVVDERPYEIDRSDGVTVHIYDFGLRVRNDKVWTGESRDRMRELFQEAVWAVWNGRAESDGFNALVLGAGLTWRQVVIIRTVAKYLRQTQSTFSQDYLENALVQNLAIAGKLVSLFETRFDPSRYAGKASAERTAAEESLVEEITRALDDVMSLDHDRIIRAFLGVIRAGLRTNYYQRGEDGAPKPYVSLKLNPKAVPDLPAPRPAFEIWVYSPRVEGVHLRFGPVARGGLRWSDRREDFRTEVLGLVKAQMVKNAVIVPTGSKGGFYAKQLPDPTSGPRRLACRGRGVLQGLHLRPARHHRQPRGRRRRRPFRRGPPRLGRPLPRRRGRQGHGDLLRHRQRGRPVLRLLAR